MQAVWKHKAAVWRRGQHRIGRRALPYLLLFQIVLPTLAPVIDIFALYGLFFLDPLLVAGYWVAFNLIGLAQAWYAFRLDGESPRPLWSAPLQQLLYRQLMYVVVIEAVLSALRGTGCAGSIERSGDVEVAS